jgi:hypothetical protein
MCRTGIVSSYTVPEEYKSFAEAHISLTDLLLVLACGWSLSFIVHANLLMKVPPSSRGLVVHP